MNIDYNSSIKILIEIIFYITYLYKIIMKKLDVRIYFLFIVDSYSSKNEFLNETYPVKVLTSAILSFDGTIGCEIIEHLSRIMDIYEITSISF